MDIVYSCLPWFKILYMSSRHDFDAGFSTKKKKKEEYVNKEVIDT